MNIFTKDKRTNLEKTIDSALKAMEGLSPDSKEYAEIASNVEKLYKAKGNEKTISPDTIAVVAGNLIGLALIMSFERANVITTKALGFVIKGRV